LNCGSVEHFQRDCPEYLEKQGIGSAKVKLLDLAESVDAEVADETPKDQQKPPPKKKKIKVVKF